MTTLCWRTCFLSLRWKLGLKCLYVTDTQLVLSDAEKRIFCRISEAVFFWRMSKEPVWYRVVGWANKQFPSTDSEMCNNRPRWIDLKSTALKWHVRLSCVSTEQFSSVQFSSAQFSSAQLSSVQFSSVLLSSAQFSSAQFRSVQFSSVWDTWEQSAHYRHAFPLVTVPVPGGKVNKTTPVTLVVRHYKNVTLCSRLIKSNHPVSPVVFLLACGFLSDKFDRLCLRKGCTSQGENGLLPLQEVIILSNNMCVAVIWSRSKWYALVL